MAQEAKMISQAGQVESLASDGLVSVSTGAGQPQKNMELAKFADSLGSSVPLQQTSEQVNITGLYARTSDGKMVELTKESVASVMAGLIGTATVSKDGLKSKNDFQNRNVPDKDINKATYNGAYEGIVSNAPDTSEYFLYIVINRGIYVYQIARGLNTRAEYTRCSIDSGSSWSPWQRIDNFGYNSLAELSSGVAGFTSNIGNKLNGIKITDLDTLRTAGIYTFSSASDIKVGLPPMSDKSLMMLVTVTSYTGTAKTLEYMQTAICGGVTYCREFYSKSWKDWKNLSNFGYNTLDELAAALKPKLGL